MTTLYHYTSGQGIFGIINSSSLHCSNVNFLNDPSEQTYFNTIINKVIENSKDCKQIFEALYNQSYQDSILGFNDQYIVSFSKNSDSLSMWNYYSKGNGYNLGFDLDLIFKRNIERNLIIQKLEMIYEFDEQYSLLKRYMKTTKKKYLKYRNLLAQLNDEINEDNYYNIENQKDQIVQTFNEDIFEFSLIFKHPAYKDEEEVRLLIIEGGPDTLKKNYKVSENGVFIEYIELKLDIELDLKSITTHPLNGNIHIEGTNRFLKSKFYNTEIRALPSKIPFRVV